MPGSFIFFYILFSEDAIFYAWLVIFLLALQIFSLFLIF